MRSCTCRTGSCRSASWQASARELEFDDDARTRFDHFTVSGKLERDADDFLLQFADLQLTRGARLERAPNLSARVSVEPGTTRIARTTLQRRARAVHGRGVHHATARAAARRPGHRIPGRLDAHRWRAARVRFDSRPESRRLELRCADSLEPTSSAPPITRASASSRAPAAGCRRSWRSTSIRRTPSTCAFRAREEPRALNLGGRLVVLNSTDTTVRFEDFTMRSDAGTARGARRMEWRADDAATR